MGCQCYRERISLLCHDTGSNRFCLLKDLFGGTLRNTLSLCASTEETVLPPFDLVQNPHKRSCNPKPNYAGFSHQHVYVNSDEEIKVSIHVYITDMSSQGKQAELLQYSTCEWSSTSRQLILVVYPSSSSFCAFLLCSATQGQLTFSSLASPPQETFQEPIGMGLGEH